MSEVDLEYERLACETLGIVHPADRDSSPERLLELGNFRIIESPAVLKVIIERHLWKLRDLINEFEDGADKREKRIEVGNPRRQKLASMRTQFRDETAKWAVLSVADFLQFNKRGDSEEKRETFRSSGRAFVRDTARMELARLQKFVQFSSNHSGYCQYLDRACPGLFFRLSQDIKALVKEEEHTTHAYIMSTTKTGKSELLKALVLNYILQPDYASVLVLDPGGDMSRQIARWPELIPQERLIFIDPAMSDTHVPVINPLDVGNLSRREKGNLAGQVVAVIGGLVEGKLGGDISIAMEAVLYPTVRLLIDLPNTSIADIPRIMIDDPRLISLGKQSPNDDVAEYFQDHFKNVNELTKKSIANKINSILGKGELKAVLCGRNSIDLKHALNNRKVVVANLAKGALDPAESQVIGMLLVALAQSIGMERVHTPEHSRPQTHIIIDECQNFVTGKLKDIIRETRKFGLSVTLAQQELGAEMPRLLRDTVIKTTNVKIAGRSDITETKKTGELVGVDAHDIQNCGPGQFFYKASNKPAFKLRVRSDRLKIKGCVDLRTWEKIKQQQIQLFYRPIDADQSDIPRQPDEPPTPPQSPKHTFE
jgi:hypothetical protein